MKSADPPSTPIRPICPLRASYDSGGTSRRMAASMSPLPPLMAEAPSKHVPPRLGLPLLLPLLLLVLVRLPSPPVRAEELVWCVVWCVVWGDC